MYMTVGELSVLIGREVEYGHKLLYFTVRVIDVRKSGRHLQVLIEPLAGRGQCWVNYETIGSAGPVCNHDAAALTVVEINQCECGALLPALTDDA